MCSYLDQGGGVPNIFFLYLDGPNIFLYGHTVCLYVFLLCSYLDRPNIFSEDKEISSSS